MKEHHPGGRVGNPAQPDHSGDIEAAGPRHDKPMIYPLSTLMLVSISEVPRHHHAARRSLVPPPSRRWKPAGVSISYAVQHEPACSAGVRPRRRPRRQANGAALVLGDNIFTDPAWAHSCAAVDPDGGAVFATVSNPAEYGVVGFGEGEFNAVDKAVASQYAVPRLYFYDNDVLDVARNLTPSARAAVRDHGRQPRLEAGQAQGGGPPRGTAGWIPGPL